ncbi:hypothetical protein [Actinoplanes palleronii]|uniref:Uncharacterized protein n=1 Tax=Actinoplanes palleronii TaxID=113570 RepID=A0ABQ4BTH0_9ACTN|nr:hypothetical protein [Actinoplanes palleronii]GIE73966.1 hypothetical protein Apa02nite_100740 [Actinoplanes palleronii]
MNYNVIVPPGFMLMGTRFAIKHLHETRSIAIDPANQYRYPGEEIDEQALADEYDAAVADLMSRPAGSGDGSPDGLLVHLPAWIMFARESDGYFVDCRSGEQHGCVMRQGAYGGWGSPAWPSVAALWEETADVLAAIGTDDEPDWVPTSVGEWRFPGAWWHPER